MAPRRKPLREISPDRGQTSIADFFTPRRAALAKPVPRRPRAPQQPPPRAHVVAVARRARASRAARPAAADARPPPETVPATCARAHDAMQVDRPAQQESPDSPHEQLTQEELDVHEQLRSLDCSQDGPETGGDAPSGGRTTAGAVERTRVFAFASEACGRMSDGAAGRNVGHTQDAEQKRQAKTEPTDDTDVSPARPDDASGGDESDDSIADIQRASALRRSARISKEVVRFGSEGVSQPRGMSVFGNVGNAKSSSRELLREFREVNQKAKREERLEKMRQSMDDEGKAGKDESLFAQMAHAEERAEQMRLAALEKYSAPVPLFCAKMKARGIPNGYMKPNDKHGSYGYYPLHDMVIEAVRAGQDGDVALSLLLPAIRRNCAQPDAGKLADVANMLFHVAVFDDTDDDPERVTRDGLLEGILLIVRSSLDAFQSGSEVPRLPPLISVLQDYGAIFEDAARPEVIGDRNVDDESLDQQVPTTEHGDASKDGDEEASLSGRTTQQMAFDRAVRNLQRACHLAAEQIRAGVPVDVVVDGRARRTTADGVLHALGVCTRILLSAFGIRLYREVGEIVNAVLVAIEEKDWATFRLRAAEYLLGFSSRLELHVELSTHLLPYDTPRARSLGFDVAFLSLRQWHAGPADKPEPAGVTPYGPSVQARAHGLGAASFCVFDVIGLLNGVPAMGKDTDVTWACLLSQLAVRVLADHGMLERRRDGELGHALAVVRKMRAGTRLMAFDVPVQHMRMALDAVRKTITEVAGLTTGGRQEVGVKEEKVQCLLARLVGQ